VDDPAVADEKASLRDRDDIAKWGHTVLQGALAAAHRPLVNVLRAAAHVDRQLLLVVPDVVFGDTRQIPHADGLLTPPSTLLTIGAGYRPWLHPDLENSHF
jgi:hypothetical protein